MATLSRYVVRELLDFLREAVDKLPKNETALIGRGSSAITRLSMANRPKRHVVAARKQRVKKRSDRADTVASIRAAVAARARGRCECGCGNFLTAFSGEMDHYLGGASKREFESVEGCWFLSGKCHRRKTNSFPTKNHWDEKFIAHCVRYGYAKMAAEVSKRMAPEEDDG